MDAELLRQLGVDQLEPEAKVILDDGLLQPNNGGFLMHDVLKRLPRELGWHSRPLRQSAHEQFADYFAQRCRTRGETSGYAMVDVLEGFHHAASAGRQSAPQGLRITIANLGYMGSFVSRANPDFCRTVLRLSDSVVTNTRISIYVTSYEYLVFSIKTPENPGKSGA